MKDWKSYIPHVDNQIIVSLTHRPVENPPGHRVKVVRYGVYIFMTVYNTHICLDQIADLGSLGRPSLYQKAKLGSFGRLDIWFSFVRIHWVPSIGCGVIPPFVDPW